MKDNNYHQDTYKPFPHVFARTASDAGFGCVQKLPLPPFFWKKRKHAPLELHLKAYVNQFTISEYKPMTINDRNEDSVLTKRNYTNLGEWSKSIGLVVFPDSEYINMCYGGNFLVEKKGILLQSEDAWKNMTISLSHGDNIQEGHFAERSWASIVAPPPLDLPMNVLSDAIRVVQHVPLSSHQSQGTHP